MKTNLPASLQRVAIASKLLLAASLLGLVFLLNGCSSTGSPVERFLFHAETNAVPVVTNWTVTVQGTNAAGIVETSNVVHWATNIEAHVTYTVSTNAAALTATAGRITDIFAPGVGELVGLGAGGLLALWARLRGKKSNKVMAEGTELLLALLETSHGKKFTDDLKARLMRDQNAAGVLREIAGLVTTLKPDNEYYRLLAKQLLDTLPKDDAPAS